MNRSAGIGGQSPPRQVSPLVRRAASKAAWSAGTSTRDRGIAYLLLFGVSTSFYHCSTNDTLGIPGTVRLVKRRVGFAILLAVRRTQRAGPDQEDKAMSTDSTDVVEAAAAHAPRSITVTVNSQPVTLPDREVTGLEVKQAAIAQGVAIGLDFQLSVKHGNRYQVVDDTDPIKVHQGQEFLAVASDDNS